MAIKSGFINLKAILKKAWAYRQEIYRQVKNRSQPIRDIIIDYSTLAYFEKGAQLKIDIFKLIEILSVGAIRGAVFVCDSISPTSSKGSFAATLEQQNMFPIQLPLHYAKQRGIDYCIETLILDTPGEEVQELLLLSKDGEHFGAPLNHVRQHRIRTLLGKLPQAPEPLLDAVDDNIDLNETVLRRCLREMALG